MMQTWRGSMAAITAAAILATRPLSCLAAGGGDPIFTLPAYKLDGARFWIIMAGMVFYGFLIDRIQFFVVEAVKHNRCSKMIVDRCITEFMVFGIVALTIFVTTSAVPNLDYMYPYASTYLTYADVLVSFAACFLILLGGVYAWMRHRTAEKLQGFDDKDEGSALFMGLWSPMPAKMHAVFIERQKVDKKSFDWNLYFQESLAHQICDLINVSWKIWLMVFFPLALIAIYKSFWAMTEDDYKDKMSSYVMSYLVVTVVLVVLSQLTVLKITRMRTRLYSAVEQYIRDTRPEQAEDDEDSSEAEEDLQEVEEGYGWWCQFLADMLQFESLALCFCLGSYVIHLLFNLNTYDKYLSLPTIVYHAVFIASFSYSLIVLFPLGLVELTSIQAFVVPDHEVLSTICSLVRDARTDLAHIRDELVTKGRLAGFDNKTNPGSVQTWAVSKLTAVNGGDPTITRMDFQAVVAEVGVKLPLLRALGVFDLVDNEHSALNPGREMSVAQTVKNCCEDLIDTQISVTELVDSAFRV